MGRSSGACFKIMTCARDPEDNGAGDAAAEEKVATDKRKWSFRRRSSKHLLSNISISGPLSIESNSKASPEAGSHKLDEPANLLQASEKVPTLKLVDVKPLLLSDVSDPTVSDTIVISKENKEVDTSYQDAVIIAIQSAVRRYLARKEFIRLKNVVKLQATVRGYLVRRQAVGTLRCVHAILKVQALVRARPQQCAQKAPNLERVEYSGYKQKIHYSADKLQTNTYSRQLLASTTAKRPIYISCDPSKSASAWMWLERWMTLTSADTVQQHELGQSGDSEDHEDKETEISISKPTVEVGYLSSSANNTEPYVCQSEFPSRSLLNGCSHPDLKDPISLPTEEFCQPIIDEVPNYNINNIDMEEVINSTSIQITAKSDANLQTEAYCEKQEVEIEKSKHTMKRMASDPVESEGKKTVIMPKRSSNPAFAAMQSKFEEMSATPSSGRPISNRTSSFHQGTVTETKSDSTPCSIQKSDKSDALSCELNLTTKAGPNSETTLPHQTQFQTANSECGTEISISSTLDSPDISETEGGEIVLEIGTLERRHFDADTNSNGNCILDHTDAKTNAFLAPGNLERGHIHESAGGYDSCSRENLKIEPENISATSEDILQKMEQADGNSDTLTSGPTPGEPLYVEQPKLHECKSATEEQGEISSPSPEASPRSHITAVECLGTPASQLESHGTPASQVSGNVKSSKRQTYLLGKKLNSPAAGKRSLSNVKSSGEKDSTERQIKDSKSLKRRNSLGMVKPDFLDNEPRISSSNSLPNYMQATESAKAKLQAINSPKSSPDVHDKESHTRKRHSLPIGNVNQKSPRMQRSASHVQQSSKESNKRSPNVAAERKWQR